MELRNFLPLYSIIIKRDHLYLTNYIIRNLKETLKFSLAFQFELWIYYFIMKIVFFVGSIAKISTNKYSYDGKQLDLTQILHKASKQLTNHLKFKNLQICLQILQQQLRFYFRRFYQLLYRIMLKTFDFYRSNNARLHNRLNQQDQYSKYLKRIDKIVDKKPSQDTSIKFYMTFMNQTKYKARCHNTLEKQLIIGYQNKHLFQKIIKAKNRKNEKVPPTYSIAMHEKRFRQQEKINQQNKQIAKRITQQYSFLKSRSNKSINRYSPSSQGQSKSPNQKQAIISWHQQIKARRLPKLVNLRT